MPGRGAHYVRRNETTRQPRRHIFLDTEARRTPTAKGERQTWRIGVACFYSAPKGRPAKERWVDYDDAATLWNDVADFCGPRQRTVLWAHNIGYDVRISEAFTALPLRGWRLVAHNVAPRSTWLEWERDGAKLVMVDSGSVFTTSLLQVGKWFGRAKEPLPDDDGTRADFLRRCRADVSILRDAVVAYLHWLELDDMGNWQLTGVGQSWAFYRHRFLTHNLLVHTDTEALAAERRAMWTGRCEAYWHGRWSSGPVQEWDFSLSYARLAQRANLPVRLTGMVPAEGNWRRFLGHPNVAVLAEGTVSTAVPVVPTRNDGRILWPTGNFDTILWDPEIGLIERTGGTFTASRVWLYRTEPALKGWADWIIDQLQAPDDDVPAWRKSILKHWSRALIGRFAMTYTDWSDFASVPADESGVSRTHVYDADSDEQWDMMKVGQQVFRSQGRVEWDQSQPAITGYIMSLGRVQLWEAMNLVPPETLLYVDTDSLLLTSHIPPASLRALIDLPGLRLKRIYRGLNILGPRQIVTDETVKVSGVPYKATMDAKGAFHGEVWESLEAAIKRGHAKHVDISTRTWHLKGRDRRRIGPRQGRTLPYEIHTEK